MRCYTSTSIYLTIVKMGKFTKNHVKFDKISLNYVKNGFRV